MKTLCICLLFVSLASCSWRMRDKTITCDNVREIAAEIAQSDMSAAEKKNILGYYEAQAIMRVLDNPDSTTWLPDLTIGEILEIEKDWKSTQDAKIAALEKLGESFRMEGGDIGETMDIATFAAMDLSRGKHLFHVLESQRAARYIRSAFAPLYAFSPSKNDVSHPDSLLPVIHCAAGTIMELPSW